MSEVANGADSGRHALPPEEGVPRIVENGESLRTPVTDDNLERGTRFHPNAAAAIAVGATVANLIVSGVFYLKYQSLRDAGSIGAESETSSHFDEVAFLNARVSAMEYTRKLERGEELYAPVLIGRFERSYPEDPTDTGKGGQLPDIINGIDLGADDLGWQYVGSVAFNTYGMPYVQINYLEPGTFTFVPDPAMGTSDPLPGFIWIEYDDRGKPTVYGEVYSPTDGTVWEFDPAQEAPLPLPTDVPPDLFEWDEEDSVPELGSQGGGSISA